jgi:transcriptional regulator
VAEAKQDLLQGTLDLLILRTLALGPLHGFGIARRLEQVSRGVFRINPGTFFPALYRLEEGGFLEGEWGRSENNRRARFYALTAKGRRRLASATESWARLAGAIERVLSMGRA